MNNFKIVELIQEPPLKGDFTRTTFKKEKHYSGVRMQQGRVQLDTDWNETVLLPSSSIAGHAQRLLSLRGAKRRSNLLVSGRRLLRAHWRSQ
ncbi:MAG: DUF6519 domain-containing protein [bacterium]